ncbi:MAG: nickel-dependent hydrogenase large subunit [Elusimicrobia bacterium]|nr:nickel-dependent hydrogenase large subunit [Elusimicrobiota bacterium]
MQNKKNSFIPIGPYHPLQEEPEFFKLFVEGERVTGIEIDIGYNHRGIEKLSEAKNFEQGVYAVERICGICSTSHPFAYVNAIENLAGIEIPERAKYIRTFVGELERLHSHMLWLGLVGHFAGYNTLWMWTWKHREPVLDIFERISGNRQHYSMMRIGGARTDIDSNDIPWVLQQIDTLQSALMMIFETLANDPVFAARTKGVGILTKQDIQDYGGVGPLARASGVAFDVRRNAPYAAYGLVDFDVITAETGDIFAKAVVRIREMLESIRMIRQCMEHLQSTAGPFFVNVKEIPPGEGIGRHEAPRGECFHYIRTDKTNRPVRHKIRAPSFMNVATNQKAVIGQYISDALLILGAVDPCYCCTERMIIVNKESPDRILTANDLLKLSHEKTIRLRKEGGYPL